MRWLYCTVRTVWESIVATQRVAFRPSSVSQSGRPAEIDDQSDDGCKEERDFVDETEKTAQRREHSSCGSVMFVPNPMIQWCKIEYPICIKE